MTDTKNLEIQLSMAAQPGQVFSALTNGQALGQWFAEHADISLSEKRYDFWGRFSPEAPDREAGRHRLLAVEPNRQLSFAWFVRGAETVVEITLKSVAEGTALTVRQTGISPYRMDEYTLSDFWSLSLENLRGWVEQQIVGVRCDFSQAPEGDVRLSVDIEASEEAVFQALIAPQELRRYMGSQAEVEPHVGGKYDYGWEEGGPIKILDLVPDQKLAYSWTYCNEPETVVTWSLAGSGGKTRLTLVHSGFAPDRNNNDYYVGWSHYLNHIKFMVEGGAAWQKPKMVVSDYIDNPQ